MKVLGLSRCGGQSLKRECTEASIREGPEELTLRAEEVGSWESRINVDNIAQDRWGPPLVDADWHAFARRSTKVLKEKTGRNCTITTKK